jgi:pyruvate formate lyase activating enzyme
MRCEYCYNTDIVESNGNYDYFEVLSFLHKRKGLLQGVVLCGGEPLFNYDKDMLEFIKKVKEMGFLIKLDTNGINYEALKELVESNLIDYVALDFKAPKYKFEYITNNNVKKFDLFLDSVKLLINTKIDFELRTTFHPKLLNNDDIKDMLDLIESLEYRGKYYIQNFMESQNNFGNLKKEIYTFDFDSINNGTVEIKYRNFDN